MDFATACTDLPSAPNHSAQPESDSATAIQLERPNRIGARPWSSAVRLEPAVQYGFWLTALMRSPADSAWVPRVAPCRVARWRNAAAVAYWCHWHIAQARHFSVRAQRYCRWQRVRSPAAGVRSAAEAVALM